MEKAINGRIAYYDGQGSMQCLPNAIVIGGRNRDTMKEPGSPRKVRLGVVGNPSLHTPFQETPVCYTLVSTSTSDS